MKLIYDLSLNELNEWILSQGLKSYRSKQIYQWLYQKRATDFEQMTELNKELIALLKETFIIDPLRLVQRQESKDGTISASQPNASDRV